MTWPLFIIGQDTLQHGKGIDWIRTWDHWDMKQPPYHLCYLKWNHNYLHLPELISSVSNNKARPFQLIVNGFCCNLLVIIKGNWMILSLEFKIGHLDTAEKRKNINLISPQMNQSYFLLLKKYLFFFFIFLITSHQLGSQTFENFVG